MFKFNQEDTARLKKILLLFFLLLFSYVVLSFFFYTYPYGSFVNLKMTLKRTPVFLYILLTILTPLLLIGLDKYLSPRFRLRQFSVIALSLTILSVIHMLVLWWSRGWNYHVILTSHDDRYLLNVCIERNFTLIIIFLFAQGVAWFKENSLSHYEVKVRDKFRWILPCHISVNAAIFIITGICLLPVFLGISYTLELIKTTLPSLLYHVQSLTHGIIPFWVAELGLGYSHPVTQDFTRYLPAYMIYLKPHHIWFGIFVLVHLIFAGAYLKKLLKLFDADTPFTPVLVFSYLISTFFVKTLYNHWLPPYFTALVWFPPLMYYTVRFAREESPRLFYYGSLLGLFSLLSYYALYLRLDLIIYPFLFVTFLLFYKHSGRKLLFLFLVAGLLTIGMADKFYNIYVEILYEGVPSSATFATQKYLLETVNQLIKPFFLPDLRESMNYYKLYGMTGIFTYMAANTSLTPTESKIAGIGIILSFLSALGVSYAFKKKEINVIKLFALVIMALCVSVTPVHFFKNLTGNWLAEPVMLLYVILLAGVGVRCLFQFYKRDIHTLLLVLSVGQILLVGYTLMPMTWHLLTRQEILWYRHREVLATYSIPPYGWGGDFRNYGAGPFIEQLVSQTDPEHRVLFTEGFTKVADGFNIERLGRHLLTPEMRDQAKAAQSIKKSKHAAPTVPCNYFDGALAFQGVYAYNSYPKGKYMGDVIDDYIWQGVYQLNSRDYLVINTDLLEILGINTVFASPGEMKIPSYQSVKQLACDDVVIDVYKNPRALKLGFLTDRNVLSLADRFISGCPHQGILCRDMSELRSHVLSGMEGDIFIIKEGNGFLVKLNHSLRPRVLFVSQMHRPGWTALDQQGKSLPVNKGYAGLLSLNIEPGVSSVHLQYEPKVRVILYYLVFIILEIFIIMGILTRWKFYKLSNG